MDTSTNWNQQPADRTDSDAPEPRWQYTLVELASPNSGRAEVVMVIPMEASERQSAISEATNEHLG